MIRILHATNWTQCLKYVVESLSKNFMQRLKKKKIHKFSSGYLDFAVPFCAKNMKIQNLWFLWHRNYSVFCWITRFNVSMLFEYDFKDPDNIKDVFRNITLSQVIAHVLQLPIKASRHGIESSMKL